MLKWMIDDWTPGPPNAINTMPGTNNGTEGVDNPKVKNPEATSKILIALHTLGPYLSSTIPKSSGAVKLMDVATTNIWWTVAAGREENVDILLP